MNRKPIYAIVATLIAFAVVTVLWTAQESEEDDKAESLGNQTASQHQESADESTHSTSTPAGSGSKVVDAQHKEEVRKGLEAIVEGLKQMGAKEVPPIAETLKEAIATGDQGDMRRAFHEASYGRFARMSESIPAMKTYLGSSDPYVRYLAAEALLRVGDQSGVDTLLALVQSNEPVAQGENDLRLSSAHLLARHGVMSAEEEIFDLYKRTSGSGLLSSLSQLQSANASSVFQTNGYYENRHSIERYGAVKANAFKPEIAKTFEQSSDLATKNAAAWSLARMSGDAQYVEHLIETARPAIEAQSDKSGFNQSTEALRYLGSIQTPEAVKVLEQALDSQNPIAVQYATVNLLFNQPGGSDKAEQLVLNELQTSPKKLGIDLTMQIASKLDNPDVKAAAQAYDLKTGGDRWRYWGGERSNWPIENWIYDYTVTLNP